jgi:hypothetical protein
MKGLEPPRLAAPDPKSDASTNFATSASTALNFRGANIRLFYVGIPLRFLAVKSRANP